jgi:hypothetical protein
MEEKKLILQIMYGILTLIIAIFIGYPLIKGQMKVGLDPVSRNLDPQRFWTAYAISTIMFIAFSVVVWIIIGRIIR